MENLEKVVVVFRYPKRKGVHSLHLGCGAFGWDWRSQPFEISPNGEEFFLEVELPVGEWQYRYVINEKRWIADPKAKAIWDMNSNKNSVIFVEPKSFRDAPRGDFLESGLKFDPQKDSFSNKNNRIVFNLECRNGDFVSVAGQIVGENEGAKLCHFEMVSSSKLSDRWRGELEIAGHEDSVKLRINGFQANDSKLALNREYVFSLARIPTMQGPTWAKGAIGYQIFPDRFADHRTKNRTVKSQPDLKRFWGGTLAGVSQKINHLVKLNVQTLYINPIFECSSYHGYDTIDFEKIDSHFGDMTSLEDLIKTAAKNKINVVLDGVFNHTSPKFTRFQSIVEMGKKSPSYHWFTILEEPIKIEPGQKTYVCWAGVHTMPKVNLEQRDPVDYFLGITAKYLDMGIGGWRFDVANEVPPSFWRSINQMVKQREKMPLLVGEHWEDATPWLRGDQWNSVMNYPWRKLVLDWLLGQISTKKFERGLQELRGRYPEECLHLLWNLLGSHDTPRVATLLGNHQGKLECAYALQMMHPGAPLIYYGDEVGMLGGHDPECRHAINWSGKDWNKKLLDWIVVLSGIRNDFRTIKEGNTREIYLKLGKEVYCVERFMEGETIRIIINRSETRVQYSIVDGWELIACNSKFTKWLNPYGVLILREK